MNAVPVKIIEPGAPVWQFENGLPFQASATTVPIVLVDMADMKVHDDRLQCRRAKAYLSGEVTQPAEGCSSYRKARNGSGGGTCGGTGHAKPCLFDLPLTDPAWTAIGEALQVDLYDLRGQCSVCGEPFTARQWEDRHSDEKGGDCHADCCPTCNLAENLVTLLDDE